MSIPPSLLFQHIAPMHWLTRCAGHLAACRHRWVAQCLIRSFAWRYRIDLGEAQERDPSAYGCFNEFFARPLRAGARPLAGADWISPADGTISQLGRIHGGQLIQAKQRAFSAEALLGDASLAARLEGGWFTTVYLSPRDYHRVHMPCDGRLLGMRYVPGELFSVRPAIVQNMDGLLARNERVVCWFEHPWFGLYALVLVGAAIVGSIATIWHGIVAPPRGTEIQQWDYGGDRDQGLSVELARGAEMGHFQLGSTVVLLLPQALDFHPQWSVGRQVRLGQALADMR